MVMRDTASVRDDFVPSCLLNMVESVGGTFQSLQTNGCEEKHEENEQEKGNWNGHYSNRLC